MNLENGGIIEGVIGNLKLNPSNTIAYGKIFQKNKPYPFVVYEENLDQVYKSFKSQNKIRIKYSLINIVNEKIKKQIKANSGEWFELTDKWELTLKIEKVMKGGE